MKKTALALVLGLMLTSIPARVLASGPPPAVQAGALVGAAVLGFVFFDHVAAANTAAKTGNEFADLNNTPGFTDLLKQQAGGSLNTLDILNK